MMKKHMANAALLLMMILTLTGCDSPMVGLGAQVDLYGPEVELVEPSFLQSISGDLHVSGTASDDQEVAQLSLSLKDSSGTVHQPTWVWKNGGWAVKNGDTLTPLSTCSDNGNLRDLEFQVDLDVSSFPEGEFTLTLSSMDKDGNTTDKSVTQRTIYLDQTAPLSQVVTPALTSNPENLSGYSLQNPALLDLLQNQGLTMSGNNQDSRQLVEMEIVLQDSQEHRYYSLTLGSDSSLWPTNATGSLRNWNITVPHESLVNSEGNTITGRIDLQLLTRVKDAGGNNETIAQGWFSYWPQSDVPWINPPSDSQIYPGAALAGMAFDDDGIQQISLSLQKADGSFSDALVLTPQGSPNSYSWQWESPILPGDFVLTMEITDINGVTALAREHSFNIEDLNAPVINLTSPDLMSTLLGDGEGDVNFTGSILDNGEIQSAQLLWLKPGNDINPFLQVDNSTPWAMGSSQETDGQGNILWQLTLGTPQLESQTGLTITNWSQQINLFSDLAISPTNPLNSQCFVIRAVDLEGSVSVKKYLTSGDFQAPEIAMVTLEVISGVSVDRSYPMTSSLNIPMMNGGETLRMVGTWSDNSTDRWSNKSRYTNFQFIWNGTVLTPTVNSDGSWSCDFDPGNENVLALEAGLEDYAGNRGYTQGSLFIESDNPVLQRISCTISNGAYRAGSVIPISLEFNKNVNVLGSPTLTLNNGGVAYFDSSSSGTSRLIYNYTVVGGQDEAGLNVTALNANGATFQDNAFQPADLSTFGVISNLGDNKSIKIDTVTPVVSSLQVLKTAGSYNAGTELLFQVEFSEDLILQDLGADPVLILNNGAEASLSSQMDNRTLLFSYMIASGEDTAALSVDSLNLQDAQLQDRAGNDGALTLPSGGDLGLTITVDTTAPSAPGVISLSGTIYENVSLNFTGEADAVIEYSFNGGASWTVGNSLSLSNSGSYNISLRQYDQAGNKSVTSSTGSFTIEKAPLITRVYTDKPDGLYKEGDVIDITVEFRKNINLTGSPRLLLNVQDDSFNYQDGIYLSKTSNTVTFRYTVGASDQVNRLNYRNVNSLDPDGAVFTDDGGTNINGYLTLPDPSGSFSLMGSKNLEILAGVPTLDSHSLSGSELTLEFSKVMYRGSGEVEVVQAAPKAPIVLSEGEYDEWISKVSGSHRSTVENSYFLGTYGGDFSSGSYEPDLTAKYILNFDLDSDNTALVNALIAAQLDRVTIPVNSSQITGSGTTTITVDLSGSYELPIKGAAYHVVMASGVFSDVLSQNYAGASAGDLSITPSGVETPIIRVQKQSESLTLTGTTLTAAQPTTTGVKLDCQTPGAEVRFTIAEGAYNASGTTEGAFVSAPADPTSGSTLASSFTVPRAVSPTVDQGYKSWIKARAFLGAESSEVAEEAALRTVVCYDGYGNFSSIAQATLNPVGGGTSYTDNGNSMFWVRGGNDKSGATVVPGYPLSWNEAEFDKIHLTSASGGVVRWMTWEIVTTGYAKMVWGTLPTTAADINNGPWQYAWWSPNGNNFDPLFAGECRYYSFQNGDSIEEIVNTVSGNTGYGNLHPRYGYY